MKKVAVITTGGTIGSVLSGDSVAVEMGARRVASEIAAVKARLGCAVVVKSPLNKNSEDLAPEDWGIILQSIRDCCESDVDGIVVTHGTDTMAYTVAAASVCAALWNKTVCFTGAFYPPDHPQSDTSLNLMAAIECVLSERIARGVYVAFRANVDNQQASIFRGADIKPMAFDDACFASLYDRTVAQYCPVQGLQGVTSPKLPTPQLPLSEIPAVASLTQARKRLAYIHLHPGIDLDFLEALSRGRDLLIADLYHSGTGPAALDSDFRAFLARKRDTLQVLGGTFPVDYIQVPYVSSLQLQSDGAHIFSNLPGHFLYAYSLMGLAAGLAVDDLLAGLRDYGLGC